MVRNTTVSYTMMIGIDALFRLTHLVKKVDIRNIVDDATQCQYNNIPFELTGVKEVDDTITCWAPYSKYLEDERVEVEEEVNKKPLTRFYLSDRKKLINYITQSVTVEYLNDAATLIDMTESDKEDLSLFIKYRSRLDSLNVWQLIFCVVTVDNFGMNDEEIFPHGFWDYVLEYPINESTPSHTENDNYWNLDFPVDEDVWNYPAYQDVDIPWEDSDESDESSFEI